MVVCFTIKHPGFHHLRGILLEILADQTCGSHFVQFFLSLCLIEMSIFHPSSSLYYGNMGGEERYGANVLKAKINLQERGISNGVG